MKEEELLSRRKAILDWWFGYSPNSKAQLVTDVDRYVESGVPVQEILKGFQEAVLRMKTRGIRASSLGFLWPEFLDLECAHYKGPPITRSAQRRFESSVAEITDAAF